MARLDLLNNVFNGSPTFFGVDQLNYTLHAGSAVPEPASWVLMIIGAGAVGDAMRRRKGKVTVTVARA